MAHPISAIVLTYNREQKIARTLESIKWVDEIIVLDGGSTDGTLEICRRYGARIIAQPKEILEEDPCGFHFLRNVGFDIAKSEWILVVDSDETVSEALAQEIRSAVTNPDVSVWSIPRRNFYWEKSVRLLGRDEQIRLFRKGCVRYENRYVHSDPVVLKGTISCLQNELIHYNYDSLGEFFERSRKYLPSEAQHLKNLGIKPTWTQLALAMPKRFWFYYVKQKAFLDGLSGFLVCALYAWYYFESLRRLKMFPNPDKDQTSQ